jgi:hypothetical protein
VLPINVVDACVPPAQPPPPRLWILLFQAVVAGSHTSMPMPAELEGALADASAKPGPTTSLTRHRSVAAVGGVPVVPGSARGSPCLNDLTSTTVVSASGLNAAFMLSSQLSNAAGGAGVGAGAGAGLSLPPQPVMRAPLAAAAQAKDSSRSRPSSEDEPIVLSPVFRCGATGDDRQRCNMFLSRTRQSFQNLAKSG